MVALIFGWQAGVRLHYLVDRLAVRVVGHAGSLLLSELGEFSGAHRDLMDGRMGLPRVGAVVEGAAAALPYVVVDAADREIDSVSRYLPDLQLGDASPLICRSYGHDLLGWFRLLLCTLQSRNQQRNEWVSVGEDQSW
jgi:hypothetical protein